MEEIFFLWQSNTVELIQEVKILMSAFAARTLKMHVATCLKEKGKQVSVMHFSEKVLVDCILYVHQSCTFFLTI
jgi:hypothetical protein